MILPDLPRSRPSRWRGHHRRRSCEPALPTLVLWDVADQPIWGAQVKSLKVGSARRLTRVTRKSLVRDLRSILSEECAARARDIAPKMTKPADAVAKAADLLEKAAKNTVKEW